VTTLTAPARLVAFCAALALAWTAWLCGCGGATFAAGVAAQADDAPDATPGDASPASDAAAEAAPAADSPAPPPDAPPDHAAEAIAPDAPPPPSDACAPVTHADGLGQSWQDCVPAGTIDYAQAAAACAAASEGKCAYQEYFVGACVGLSVCSPAHCWGYDYTANRADDGPFAPAHVCAGACCPTAGDPSWQ
jgi:hypothetical protein